MDVTEFGSKAAGRKGGNARAKKLSKAERSEIARKAAATRWERKGEERGLPRAICGGLEPLRIGMAEIPCYVLDDERRVIALSGMFTAIGMQVGGGLTRLVSFASQLADNPSGAKDLSARLESPVEFIMPKGGLAKGYEADLLVNLCEVILDARRAGRLTERYRRIAEAAEAVLSAFAVVGVVALIDEATGYQTVRRRLELAEILDRYLDDRLNKWTKTFSDDYYIELFRLLGWDYENLMPGDSKPAEIGRITRDVVYRRLHPGIVQELQERNPYVVKWRRMYKHHQWLTREVGHPVLKEHLAKIITTMKLSDDYLDFMHNLSKTVPVVSNEQGWFDEFFKDDESPTSDWSTS